MIQFNSRITPEVLDQIFNSMQEGVFFINEKGLVLMGNPAFRKLLGYEQKNLAGKSFADIAGTLQATDSQAMKSIEGFNLSISYFLFAEKKILPIKMISLSGAAVPVSIRTVVLRNQKGAVTGGIGIMLPEASAQEHDISSQEDTEMRKIWEMEQNYRNILKNSGDAILICDFNGCVVTANEAFLKMLGYDSEEELLGKYFMEFAPVAEGAFACTTGETIVIDKTWQQQAIDMINTVFESELAQCESYVFKKDRTLVPVEATMSLLKNRSGESRGTILICRDITQRILSRKETLQTKMFLENVFKTTADGIFVMDHLGHFTLVNNAFCQIMGYPPEEIIGKYSPDFMPDPEHQAFSEEDFEKMYSENYFSNFESVWQRKDGTCFPLEVKIATLINSRGEEEGMVGTIRDITERKNIENQLRESQAILEQKVKDRTGSLEEANIALRVLLEKREEDKRALEDKVLFNVNELIGPYMEKLRNTRLDERQRVYLDILETNMKDIVSPFMRGLSIKHLRFTPTEIQIANLIKQGRTTKEIAEVMSLCSRTIEFHRENIRDKVGLKNSKINLRVYLQSIQ